MSNDKIETLDDLIRERAKKELEQEVRKAFAPLANYFDGGSRRGELILKTSNAVQVRKDASDPDEQVVWLFMPELLRTLQEKAIANVVVDRGNLAVAEFMERVEDTADEINDLRSQVGE